MIRLRTEQMCCTPGCTRPMRHAELCSACYRFATPAQRAVADLAAAPTVRFDSQAFALQLWFDAPAVDPERRAA